MGAVLRVTARHAREVILNGGVECDRPYTKGRTPRPFWPLTGPAINEGGTLMDLPGRIYFAECEELGRIKIGHSRTPFKRIRTLQIGTPTRIKLVAMMPGLRDEWVHHRFAHLWVTGEWFRFGDEIRAFISKFAVPPERAGELPWTVLGQMEYLKGAQEDVERFCRARDKPIHILRTHPRERMGQAQ